MSTKEIRMEVVTTFSWNIERTQQFMEQGQLKDARACLEEESQRIRARLERDMADIDQRPAFNFTEIIQERINRLKLLLEKAHDLENELQKKEAEQRSYTSCIVF